LIEALSKSEIERLVEDLKISAQAARPARSGRVKGDGSPAARIKRALLM
jgi:hypothetical protein